MIKNQWYAIASSREVKEDNVVGIRRLGMDLVLYRKNGKVSGLIDMCSHRGAKLSCGTVHEGNIKCPFHGIEFNENGHCVLIPANGVTSDENFSRFNIKKIFIEEVLDTIFLWYGDSEPNKEIDYFKELDESFAMDEVVDHWKIHYSRSIENQLDVVHLPFVHHNTIGKGNKTLVNGPKVIWLDENTLQTSADNEVDKGQKPKKPKDSTIKSTNLKFKFPNIWLNDISDKIKVLGIFAPIDDENTLIYFRFYNKITGVKAVDRFIAFLGKFGNLVVERQDKRVVETQRPKASSFKGSGENLIQGDKPIIEYRKRRFELKEENKEGLEN